MDIDVVAENNADWIEWAVSEICHLAGSRAAFSSDELRSQMVEAGRTSCHPNAIGAAFRIASNWGVIEQCGFIKSDWPTNHKRIVALWRAA